LKLEPHRSNLFRFTHFKSKEVRMIAIPIDSHVVIYDKVQTTHMMVIGISTRMHVFMYDKCTQCA